MALFITLIGINLFPTHIQSALKYFWMESLGMMGRPYWFISIELNGRLVEQI